MICTTGEEGIAARRYEALSLPNIKDVEAGVYTIFVAEGGTYRDQTGTPITYTVQEIDGEWYRVVDDKGGRRNLPASELGLVEAVEGSVGGIEAFVPYEEATGEAKRKMKEEAFVLAVEGRADVLDPACAAHVYARNLYEDPEEAGPIAIADRERVPADWSDAEAVDRVAEVIMDQCPGAQRFENKV